MYSQIIQLQGWANAVKGTLPSPGEFVTCQEHMFGNLIWFGVTRVTDGCPLALTCGQFLPAEGQPRGRTSPVLCQPGQWHTPLWLPVQGHGQKASSGMLKEFSLSSQGFCMSPCCDVGRNDLPQRWSARLLVLVCPSASVCMTLAPRLDWFSCLWFSPDTQSVVMLPCFPFMHGDQWDRPGSVRAFCAAELAGSIKPHCAPPHHPAQKITG